MPAIKRRVKSNARRLKLSIQHHQIFLTTPPNVSEQKIQLFLKESEFWLHETWNKVYVTSSGSQTPINGEIIELPLLNQYFEVILDDTVLDSKNDQSKVNQISVINSDSTNNSSIQLLVPANTAGKLLKQWLRDRAAIVLPQRLSELAKKYDFEYSSCQVRHAKTRWGSCSTRKSINLNAALILMPVAVLDYVILHELCHTRQLNHSAQFWYEVHKVDANYMQHRQLLKQFKLPSWWHVS